MIMEYRENYISWLMMINMRLFLCIPGKEHIIKHNTDKNGKGIWKSSVCRTEEVINFYLKKVDN